MRTHELIRQLALAADRGAYPPVDVAPAVLRRLRALPAGADRPLLILALGTAFSAVLVSLFALPAWENWADPLTQVLIQLSGVLR